MTKDKIKEWLDRHIDLTNQILDNKFDGNEILGLFLEKDCSIVK